MDGTDVVTCFCRHDGQVLFFKRGESAETYPGRWGTVTGYVEHPDPLATARMEIREETGLAAFELVRRGEPFTTSDETLDRSWRVHPFLFEVSSREITTNEETARSEWTSPTELLKRETVPDLWRSYDRIRPTPETIADDREHGSAYLSIRALEVLRDEAGLVAERDGDHDTVRSVAVALLSARPSMAALTNRVNRTLADADTPSAVERAARAAIDRAIEADGRAASLAAAEIEGHVLTLSRSGTVLAALREHDAPITVAESRPALEGVDVAESLADAGLSVRLCTDAAIAHRLASGDIDCILLGADTVLPDGRVLNKTGSRGTALGAEREGVPVYVAAASDKISTDETPRFESGPPEAVYDGTARIEVHNPTVDVTPADCIEGVITERGVLSTPEVGAVAAELREYETWQGD